MIAIIENRDSVFIKNHDEFLFNIDPNGEIITNNIPTIQSKCGSIKFFINGIIYNQSLTSLMDCFMENGLEFVSMIEGSFVIFIIHNGSFITITDSFNSKKAYYLIEKDTASVSNNINELPLNYKNLSVCGITSYLVNGIMLNDLTLFNNVKSFNRATVNIYTEKAFISNVYKPYLFKYNDANFDEEALKKELEKIIVESIEKKISVCDIDSTTLSLSAGYDARGILGIIAEKLKIENVDCFSYAINQYPNSKTDAYIAKKLASKYGYKHKIINSYSGNLLEHLEKNALYGKGVANFCDELAVWESDDLKNNYTDVLVGDEVFGWADVPLNTKEEVFECLGLKNVLGIKWLKKYLPKQFFNIMSDSLESSLNELYVKADSYEDMHDKKDYLYLEQRENQLILPWRENYTSKVGFVHNPYLDEKILSFMMKVPPSLRKNKALFRSTISGMLPELYRIETAKLNGYKINWEKEISRFKNELVEEVNNSYSYLDDLIPVSSIIDLINIQNRKPSRIKNLWVLSGRGANYLRKKILKLDHILRYFVGPRVSDLDHTVFLLRLLTLRMYLKSKQ